jgi:hypothetical protein
VSRGNKRAAETVADDAAKIVQLVQGGMKLRDAARELKLPHTTARRLYRRGYAALLKLRPATQVTDHITDAIVIAEPTPEVQEPQLTPPRISVAVLAEQILSEPAPVRKPKPVDNPTESELRRRRQQELHDKNRADNVKGKLRRLTSAAELAARRQDDCLWSQTEREFQIASERMAHDIR